VLNSRLVSKMGASTSRSVFIVIKRRQYNIILLAVFLLRIVASFAGPTVLKHTAPRHHDNCVMTGISYTRRRPISGWGGG
jgi:ABC-type enterobactin transport system permease subunit